ncbi:hypothetical protein K458DRAFT_377432 [Lentithecium fluviatile CBS 122367]|uniref:Uncharacterized protein n=1 Tax=Lentithecium fluviatile CBS 122367 TaxID=1168545 RepID=A0A6G1IIK0_9PLEO|nr:hypothetical protein K458DRAFT_377432 [Lentithecium fluviatile CBS 122367]
MMQQSSAQARLTLNDAFERFAATVTPDDKRDFTNTKLKDVREEAIRIERQLRARHNQKNMARLEPFLRGMEHYSKVVEVLCNGTPYLSWIWAPVKLMLTITVDSLVAFEKLIEAYGKIADMLPRFDRLATALSHDHNFQALLALVYADILEFHRRAYKFVRRKSWAIFFGSMWDGFESRFGDILRNLANHSELVDKEAVAVDISDAVARSKEEADRWEQQEREWQALKVRAVLSWLATDDPPPEDALERNTRDCLPGSCDWFIQHHKTQSWLKDGAEKTILWLYGKPGAGKSVLCSNLVQHAEAKGTNIFVYFCSYLGNSTESSSRILRSLCAQMIQKHQDLAPYIYHKYSQSHPVPSRKALLGLLSELLQSLGSVRFVIDGIDEWDEREQKEALQDLTQMLSTDPSSSICKILLASRDTLEISRGLRKKNKATVSISLNGGDEGTAIDCSIEHFIENKLSDLPGHFDKLDPDGSVIAQVKRTLLKKSNGMFLWVRLVLDSLEVVYSPEDLGNLVEDLPSDLEALYRRILHRLCNVRGAESYGGVSTILSWICFSRRPLHKLELLHGLAVSPSDGASGAQSVPVPQILEHCKPFIEERPDSTIAFVHFSVKEFLLRSNATEVVPLSQVQLHMSLSCATTLIRGLDLLHQSADPSAHHMRIVSGIYRLLPYALEYWIEHCLRYAASGGSLEPECLLSRRLAELRDKHSQCLQTSESVELANTNSLEAFDEWPPDDRLKHMAHLSIHGLMREVLRVRRSAGQQICENGEAAEAFATQNDRTLFSKLAADFDNTVIYLLSQDEVPGISRGTLEAFQKSYASTAFRCRFPNCSRSSTGFPSSELRGQHEAAHLCRVYCRVVLCQWSRIGFKNKNGLDTHMRKHHGENSTFSIPPKVRRIPQDGEASERKTQEETNDSLTNAVDNVSTSRIRLGLTDFGRDEDEHILKIFDFDSILGEYLKIGEGSHFKQEVDNNE